MSNNRRIGSRPAPFMRTDRNGLFQHPGPYIGIIKNNYDPTCNGRLQVYLPIFGGPNENDPANWVTVSYASPFRGQTRQRADLSWYVDSHIDITASDDYIQENSFQSYGFWFVPPDLNGRVLCFFANGDPTQGYWTSCISDSMDSHMIPAIGAVKAAADDGSPTDYGYIWRPYGANALPTHTMLQNYIQISGNGLTEIPYRLPISEPVITAQANSNPNTPARVVMVPHVYQTLQLGIQGLAFDFIRGSTSATITRESPSQVFGISTPGRLSSFSNVELSENILSQISSIAGTVNISSNSSANISNINVDNLTKILNCPYRTGGHQIVMDDGTINGYDQGIRIRTTKGNEILLDDTNGQIYIINSQGTSWIELSPSGFIDIYSEGGYSVRSKGDINFHADQDINLNAKNNIKLHSDSDIQIDATSSITSRSTQGTTIYDTSKINIGSGGSLSLSGNKTTISSPSSFSVQSASLNLPGPATPVNDPGSMISNKHVEVSKQSGTNAYWQTGTFNSITSRAPAHEPWPNHEIDGIRTAEVEQGNADGSPIVRIMSGYTSSGVRGTGVGSQITEADLAKQPITGAVCGLSIKETQALFAAIGKSESSWPNNRQSSWRVSNGGTGYYAVNQLGYSGKYQFGASALETCGLLKPGSSRRGTNAQVIGNSSNWSGFLGVNSPDAWLSNSNVQEQAMMLFMKKNCQALRNYGIINSSSSSSTIAGYLCITHLVGIKGAIAYHNGNSNTSDANGTTAGAYYAKGVNAIHLADSAQNA